MNQLTNKCITKQKNSGLERNLLAASPSMTDSTENATPPKSTKSRNSNSSVHIQIKPKFELEFVPRDAKKSEFHDLVDFGCVAILVENVMLDQMVVNVNVPAAFAIPHAPSCTASCSRLIRHTPSQKAYVNIFVYVHAYVYESLQ